MAVEQSGSTMKDLSKFFLDYLDDQYTMLQRIKPTIVGHFDLCRLFSPGTRLDEDPEVWTKVKRNVEFIIAYGGLFEVNAASFRKGWDQAYPGTEVLQVSSIRAHPPALCAHIDPQPHPPSAYQIQPRQTLFIRRLAWPSSCRIELRTVEVIPR